jgi:hypothetical protein
MATTSVRRSAMRTILAALADADRKLLVSSGWPGDKNERPRMLWVDDVRSTEDRPVITGGRLHRDDMFTITLLMRVTGHRTTDAAHDDLETIDALIDDYFAADHTLDDLDGIVSAEVTEGDFTVGTTPTGVVGYGRREVMIHARLT